MRLNNGAGRAVWLVITDAVENVFGAARNAGSGGVFVCGIGTFANILYGNCMDCFRIDGWCSRNFPHVARGGVMSIQSSF